jgi:prepilin-type N-terminal cleavage/methylation domain-containing protein
MTSRSGYSLIEILVVVGIIGIMAGAGVAVYNQMNMQAQVEMEAKRAAAKLRDWQKEADSGAHTQACSAGEVFEGIKVTFAANSIDADRICDSNTYDIETFYLQNGVTLTPSGAVTFLSNGQGATPKEVFLGKGGVSYRINISLGGGISVSKIP